MGIWPWQTPWEREKKIWGGFSQAGGGECVGEVPVTCQRGGLEVKDQQDHSLSWPNVELKAKVHRGGQQLTANERSRSMTMLVKY